MSSSTLARPVLRQSGAWSRMAARRFESSTTAKATEATKETASKASNTAKETASKASETTKQAASKASETTKETASKASEATKETASKASSSASEYASKAQQGLSKVTSSAGPAIAGAAKGMANSLSRVGGRTGRMVAFVEKQVPKVVYYSKVGAELSKMVFHGQKMSPPSVSTMQSYYQNAMKIMRNPSSLMQTASQTAEKAAQQPASILQRVQNINRAQLVAGGVVLAECLGFFSIGEMVGRFKIIGYHGDNGAAHH
ncbi:Uu.00g028130.m01.CDS01 [Anthostomella pinea]|uniref:Uu.00g028130.m01.CDS01 n=1 Tax=Anthostomella pinea TaxID=933095 RepID=A0AAI8V8V7_9PEZI|nr:Uu.00g028130.m01.CDS01 [Anthostomella pinea]